VRSRTSADNRHRLPREADARHKNIDRRSARLCCFRPCKFWRARAADFEILSRIGREGDVAALTDSQSATEDGDLACRGCRTSDRIIDKGTRGRRHNRARNSYATT
jgi:hypothetical protein